MKKTWKLTAKHLDDIVRAYEAGESSASLAAEFGVCQSNVCKLLQRRGVPARGVRKFPMSEVGNAAKMYEGGMRAHQIAAHYGVSRPVIIYALRDAGFAIRSGQLAHRKYPVNDAAFDIATDEAAYWRKQKRADEYMRRW